MLMILYKCARKISELSVVKYFVSFLYRSIISFLPVDFLLFQVLRAVSRKLFCILAILASRFAKSLLKSSSSPDESDDKSPPFRSSSKSSTVKSPSRVPIPFVRKDVSCAASAKRKCFLLCNKGLFLGVFHAVPSL